MCGVDEEKKLVLQGDYRHKLLEKCAEREGQDVLYSYKNLIEVRLTQSNLNNEIPTRNYSHHYIKI